MEKTFKELQARVDPLTEEANRLFNKQDMWGGEGRQDIILNIKYLGDQIDDQGETSEESYKMVIDGERGSGRDIMEWISDNTRVTCVIWCGKMLYWRLVFEAVGLRITGIWGEYEVWRRQSRRWWPVKPWNNEEA